MRKFYIFMVVVFIIATSLGCGGKKEGAMKEEKTPQQLITERFNLYKQAYQGKDIDAIMEIIASTYYDKYNNGKDAYRSYIQSALAGWTWKSIELDMVGEIEYVPGYHYTHQEPRNAMGSHDAARQIEAVNSSQDVLLSSRSQLDFGWEQIGGDWYITRITGPIGRVITQPATVSAGSEVTVSVFTLPEGASLTAYDTESAAITDWDGNSIALQDQGDRLYSATFTAPSSAGQYTLHATVKDTTSHKIISLDHTFTVE